MELNQETTNSTQISDGHIRCLIKAIERAQYLLAEETALQDYDKIHSVKSILYAAIEQMGMKAERMFFVQRLLRELLSIIGAQYASPGHDKQVGLQILEDLKSRSQML